MESKRYRRECHNVSDFTTGLHECEQISIQCNGDNKLSWCPDCVRAEPIINAALDATSDGYVLYECDVDRESYRTKDYIYRTDARIGLTCVPTLMKWSNNKCIARLNDSQSQNADLVKELFES